jgi:sec-independent protein translocase protein TatA
MPHLGVPELLIILVIIVVVFGVGRLGDIGGALGKGIREFRKASSGEDEQEHTQKELPEANKAKEE